LRCPHGYGSDIIKSLSVLKNMNFHFPLQLHFFSLRNSGANCKNAMIK